METEKINELLILVGAALKDLRAGKDAMAHVLPIIDWMNTNAPEHLK